MEAAKNDLETQTNQGRQVAAHGAANVQQLEATIGSLNDQLRDAQARQSQMEEELSTQVNQFKEAQESYHRELKSHSQTANNLKQLKGTIKKYDITITELTQAKKVISYNKKNSFKFSYEYFDFTSFFKGGRERSSRYID